VNVSEGLSDRLLRESEGGILVRHVDDGFALRSFHYVFRVSLRLISCFLSDRVIYRLFGLWGEIGTDGPEKMLSAAAHLMKTIDDKSEVD
jgi:hypothetical protein